MSQSGLLELAHEKLHWPTPQEILEPSGAGPSVYARIAREKLGRTISKLSDGHGVQIGVLAGNPQGDSTETPIALVCDFPTEISEETLRKTHQLAWSFSRTPSLITTEPNRLRIWTCYEKPPKEKDIINPVIDVSKREIESFNQVSLSGQAAETLRLHWADLVSGQFFQEHSQRFQRKQAADQMLLKNLKSVRKRLQKNKLDDDTIHDLLARIIFIQFLFDRQDFEDNPALNITEKLLLSARYSRLADILRNHRDTYQFFRWLNSKFNGDLFPGKGATEEEREAEWQTEEQKVKELHLNILADFVSGHVDIETGQLSLWPYYHFDVIPLEFISSIYEEFVSKESGTGVHYTPEHIVDFVLDGVLPWDSQEWDIKILDPACGSGIFLVKAFQRLIHRWEQAHPKTIQPSDLKYLLENNLFGIDVDAQAVRVASFSLYLTMLDKVEPQYYWENEFRFPRLRERQLIAADFFQEDKEGFRSVQDAGKYDLVVGNAPWGKNTVTPAAKSWARDVWTITYGNIGPLFLPKAAALTKSGGQIAMMQPALALIFNQVGTAQEFRSRLFSEFKIDEIVNLSALRFGLFKDAISPACIITMSAIPPDGEPLTYICPKPVMTNEDDYHIVIEPDYINTIYPQEAIANPLVWTALMWGGRRDLSLVKRLNQESSIKKLKQRGIAKTRQGVIRSDGRKVENSLLNKRILESDESLDSSFLYLNAEELPINDDPCIDSGTGLSSLSAFQLPQMIVKQSWQKESLRFCSVIVNPDGTNQGIICSKSYVSIHIPDENISQLNAACLSYNSKLAVYYLLLTSGRFASYIPEVNVNDLLRVPIPKLSVGELHNIKTIDGIDERIRQAFEFKDSEWVLINDLFNYTLPDFKGDVASPGRKRTHRIDNNQSQNNTEPELTAYCEYFLRVLKAGFGQDKQVCATIFQEQTKTLLPVRLVAIYLNKPDSEGVHIKTIDSPDLMERLESLNKLYLERGSIEDGGIFYQRVARIYDSVDLNGVKIPTIYLIKPDKIRYWTRSMALRDADEVAADIMT
ncbi:MULTISPECIES: N-6 DNA methylase [Nostocales]|uniref:SAM-dependent DNA methyltransferase n=1 Tax=Dolichospermum flos-aquae UHCC 0037 TaxID=2590026 RepID=A0ACC7SAQ4_DOLFA|nr:MULTISPECIES: N-6 DNA methylase [Nostocales]MBO1066022.1 SAM-dependent DNA methyltransferase [Anabaena sp. 54]MTJ45309.1 SAM-dependent DNA methyltransferase [Dolichospermum flos-aquae UHCC 0037]